MSSPSDVWIAAQYAVRQVLWLLQASIQLIGAMGTGILWMQMAVRLIIFAMLNLVYFIPHVIWYAISPTIIRRVSYRSSVSTKARNLRAVLRRERNRRSSGARDLRRTNHSNQSGEFESEQGHEKEVPLDTIDPMGLASHINPADGSTLAGLPLSSTAKLDKLFLSRDGVANSSFDEALALLNRYGIRTTAASTHSAQPQLPQFNKSPERAHAGNGSDEDEGNSDDDREGFGDLLDTTLSASIASDEEEDKLNLHNRAFLDIYLPVPMDTLFRVMTETKLTRKVVQTKKFPILICVNGGAWIVGFNFWNFLVARLFAARGYVVFSPDYRNFPQATMEEMVLDVSDAISWVLKNAERYNGDLDDVTLIGQSAGAHLSMMSLVSQAHQCAYLASKEGGTPLQAPSPQAYNVPRYNPRTSIHHYIGLSGIYNVRSLTNHFNRRGLYKSVLYQIAGGRSKLARFSPPTYFESCATEETGECVTERLLDYLPQKMSYVHGDADKSAPLSESANMAAAIQNLQRERLERAAAASSVRNDFDAPPIQVGYYVVPGATHTDAIIDEVLSCRKSHVVDFVCSVAAQERRSKRAPRVPPKVKFYEGDGTKIIKRPDEILCSPSPYSQRSRLLQLSGLVCPF